MMDKGRNISIRAMLIRTCRDCLRV